MTRGSLRFFRQSVRIWVAASHGRSVATNSSAHAMAANSRLTVNTSSGHPPVRWTGCPPNSKTANSKSTLSISGPMCLTRKRSADRDEGEAVDEKKKIAAGIPGSRTLPKRIFHWLDRRAGLDKLMKESLDEPIPGGARLAYVFGSGLLFIFISQIITGICLAIYRSEERRV